VAPLKMTVGRIEVPAADIVSIIDTHSRFLGDLTYDVFVDDLPTTH
jgi:hypothetical protein